MIQIYKKHITYGTYWPDIWDVYDIIIERIHVFGRKLDIYVCMYIMET